MVVPTQIKAQDFFDTSEPAEFFTIGARIGFNTSNRTFPNGYYVNQIFTTWGTGFNVGAIANLNFKDYLTLQPGLFFESRSGNLMNVAEFERAGDDYVYYEKDHMRNYYLTVPVMGIVNFNLAENIRWKVEFGPYLQFSLKQTGSQNDVNLIYFNPIDHQFVHYQAKHHSFDFGLKIGTGLQFYEHYYVGVHYLAGLCNAWSTPSGGRNKSWMFTLGYDF